MPEYGGEYNKDGSPHGLHKSIVYSSMPYQYMRASTVWVWFTEDAQFKPFWAPFHLPHNETAAQLRAWLRARGQCSLNVKTWQAAQCVQCKRNYTVACKQVGHDRVLE